MIADKAIKFRTSNSKSQLKLEFLIICDHQHPLICDYQR